MTTMTEAVRDAALTRLRRAGCVFAEDELAVLLEAADRPETLADLVTRRAAGEPLEQVVGWADFAGVRVMLRPGVFVPRHRSELLVRLAADRLRDHSTPEGDAGEGRAARMIVVDLCCGSGALAVALASRVPRCDLYAADLDEAAVACARANLAGIGAVFQGDLFAALPAAIRGRIDVLLANVPYVPTDHLRFMPAEARLYEPTSALDGGADGLDLLRRVAEGAATWLAPGGVLLSEVASTQAATEAVAGAGLTAWTVDDEDLEATAVIGRRP